MLKKSLKRDKETFQNAPPEATSEILRYLNMRSWIPLFLWIPLTGALQFATQPLIANYHKRILLCMPICLVIAVAISEWLRKKYLSKRSR